MENVTVGWISGDWVSSERNVPTLWIGKHNVALGSKNDIHVVMLEGYDRMPRAYLDDLESVGYTVIDAEKTYREIAKKYSGLDRFSPYEKKCFLRWPVIRELFGRSPLIHYDGDVVFNETPEGLCRALKNNTAVVQGCPAIAALNDPTWLDAYCRNLAFFAEDVEGYSAEAWRSHDGYLDSCFRKWAGIRYRKTISSDQDLIRHLIHIDALPQDDPASIMADNPDLMFFENPLFFFLYNMSSAPFVYNRKSGVDYISGKKVAFWHLQSNFSDYLKMVYITRHALKLPFAVDNPLEPSIDNGPSRLYSKYLYQYSPRIRRMISRRRLCEIFFEKGDLSAVFDRNTFWCYPETKEDGMLILKKYEKYN